MYDVTRGSRSRCLLTWLAASATATALVGWVAPDLAAAHRALGGGAGQPPLFDAWLTWLCALATGLCAVWGWLVTSVVVLEALTGRPRRSALPGVPAWARRLVLAVCGVAVLGAAAPAVAADHRGPEHRERHSVLDGLPLPDRAEGRSVTELVAETMAAQSEQTGRSESYVVRPGDSLWSVAGTSLGDPTAWPRIYALNRDLVGPDPDLILPGQLLRLPDPPPGKELR
jgi:hypothetical protein